MNKAMKKAREWATWLSEGRVLQAGEMASAKALRQAVPGMFQEQHRGQASVAGADLWQGERRVIDEVREAWEGGADCMGCAGHCEDVGFRAQMGSIRELRARSAQIWLRASRIPPVAPLRMEYRGGKGRSGESDQEAVVKTDGRSKAPVVEVVSGGQVPDRFPSFFSIV